LAMAGSHTTAQTTELEEGDFEQHIDDFPSDFHVVASDFDHPTSDDVDSNQLIDELMENKFPLDNQFEVKEDVHHQTTESDNFNDNNSMDAEDDILALYPPHPFSSTVEHGENDEGIDLNIDDIDASTIDVGPSHSKYATDIYVPPITRDSTIVDPV